MTVLGALMVSAIAAAAEPAPVEIYVSVAPPIIPFHRQARYSIIVEAPARMDVLLPEMTNQFGGLNIYGPPERKVEPLRNGRERITETYTLDPTFAGDYRIEPVKITWANDGNRIVPSPGLRVRDLTPDEEAEAMQFASNDDPFEIRHELWRNKLFWGGIAALMAIGLGAWGIRRLRLKATRPAAPPPPPWEVAYARLRKLDNRHLPQAGQWDAYYVELSAILREYIEARLQVRAPEHTTPEFLAEATRSGLFTSAQQQMLAVFLRQSDRVKFAQHQPTMEEMDGGLARVLQFVDETVPRPQPTQEEAAA
jgi:hypothetical protein